MLARNSCRSNKINIQKRIEDRMRALQVYSDCLIKVPKMKKVANACVLVSFGTTFKLPKVVSILSREIAKIPPTTDRYQ